MKKLRQIKVTHSLVWWAAAMMTKYWFQLNFKSYTNAHQKQKRKQYTEMVIIILEWFLYFVLLYFHDKVMFLTSIS